MKLTFIGADHQVTGSCHFLEVGNMKVLIDCGMEQGNIQYKNAELPVSYKDIDYVYYLLLCTQAKTTFAQKHRNEGIQEHSQC